MEQFVKFVCRIYFGLFYKVKIYGKENIPPEGSSAILCANHVTNMDMFFIAYSLKRLVHFMAKQELFDNLLVRFVLKRVGAFPVKRGKGDIESIKMSLRLLAEGHILGIFPQGTRTGIEDPKKLQPKAGTALLAVKSGAPVIPVSIEGSFKVFSRIRINIGKPFYLPVEKGRKYTSEELMNFSGDIMEKVYDLMESK